MENKNYLNIKTSHYVFAFMIIYSTDSLMFATNASGVFQAVGRFGVIILAVSMLLRNEKIKGQKFELVPVFLSVSVVISLVLSQRFKSGYFFITMIGSIWFAYLYSRECSLEQFSYCFCKIMRIIAIVSLIGWLFSSAIAEMSFIPTITNTVGLKYKTLFFTNVPVNASYAQRNMGAFWEPGAYQIYLNVALFFVLFIEKKNNKVFDAILFVVTCLTTKSGAALVPMVLLLVAYTFDANEAKSIFLVIIMGVIMGIMFNIGDFSVITEKMTGGGGTDSMTYRMIGIEGAIKGFLENPFFGSTPIENEIIKMELAIEYLGETYSANTNTYLNYFAYFGVFVGSFMLIRAWKLFFDNMNSSWGALLAFCAYFISTSNEEMMTSLLIITLSFLKSEKVLRGESPQSNKGLIGGEK